MKLSEKLADMAYQLGEAGEFTACMEMALLATEAEALERFVLVTSEKQIHQAKCWAADARRAMHAIKQPKGMFAGENVEPAD